MTYGPQPGWNPNQPPVGPPPGYPQQPASQQAAGPQPIAPQPMGQPVPGYPPPPGYPAQQPGYPVAGYAPQQPGFPTGPNPYAVPKAPQSPLLIIPAVIAVLMFASLTYTVIGETAGFGRRIPNYNLAFIIDFHQIAFKLHLIPVIIYVLFGLIAILWLIGGIFLLRRNPIGRVLAIIATALTLVIRIFTVASFSGGVATQYIFVLLLIATAVLLLLPATSKALGASTGRQPAGFGQPAYPQQQFAPPGQPGFPQQQPPAGYQQQPPSGYGPPPA